MNHRTKRVVVALSLLGFSVVVGCSTGHSGVSLEPVAAGVSGSPAASQGGALVGGAAGAATDGSLCEAGCPAGQLCSMGACACPGYAPLHCAAAGKCVDVSDDPDFCGDCTTACAGTSTCSASKCTTPPTAIYETTGCGSLNLVAQAGKLYWLDTLAGSVHSLALSSLTPLSLATGLGAAGAFAVDADSIYVVTGSSLTRVPSAGGATKVVVTEALPIFDVAVQAGKLYYAVGSDVKSVSAVADAGSGTVVASGIDKGEPQGVAVAGNFVLYASSSAYNVEADPIDGEGHLKLGASQGGLIFGHGSVRTDGTSVFWALNNSVERAAFAGDDMGQKNAASAKGQITAYAISSTTAYVASEGNLEKAVFGEPAAWMARGLGEVRSITLDGTSVYLSTNDCKILRATL